MLLGLLFKAISGDASGKTYSSRQVISSTTTFLSCTFEHCTDSASGGAICVSSSSVGLDVASCLFATCRASSGGAVYTSSCLFFSMIDTSGFNCSTTSAGLLCFIHVSSSLTGSLEVRRSSATSCSGSSATLEVQCATYTSGSTTYIVSLNSSSNQATRFGSGLLSRSQFNLAFWFSFFSGNGRGGCLTFFSSIQNNDIYCLMLVGNSCTSDTSDPGFILADSTIVMSSCVFQSNTFDYFVGSEGSYAESVTFIDCVFGFETINKTRSVTVTSTSCTVVAQPTQLPQCITGRASQSRTPSESQSAQMTASGRHGPSSELRFSGDYRRSNKQTISGRYTGSIQWVFSDRLLHSNRQRILTGVDASAQMVFSQRGAPSGEATASSAGPFTPSEDSTQSAKLTLSRVSAPWQ
jgi:hypothetical protein